MIQINFPTSIQPAAIRSCLTLFVAPEATKRLLLNDIMNLTQFRFVYENRELSTSIVDSEDADRGCIVYVHNQASCGSNTKSNV